jgi:hypothetical protein
MSNKTNSFKKLIDRLQEDSWQLELLISGFAILGLFYTLDPIGYKLQEAQLDNNYFYIIFLVITYFSLKILIFNLLLHVVLRGLWIGSLGIRYVFGDIDFEQLNYSELFTKHLKRKVGSFDNYISKLENTCSIIFGITFLLVFYIFSFFIISYILLAFNSSIPDWAVFIVRILFILIAIGAILTFFDFITQGLLKKNKWVAKVYFPFYRVFSLLTLSFFYRPIIYNLLDNKRGRQISLGLIPFYFLIYVVFHLNYQKSNFITPESTKLSSHIIANGRNYEDVIEKGNNVFMGEFMIQSKVIMEPYVKLIVPLSSTIEDNLIEFNTNLTPEKDQRGLYFQSEIVFNKKETNYDYFNNEYLSTFEKYYHFKIDTTSYQTDFVITNTAGQLSFESYIGILNLSEGKHVIEFQSLKNSETDSLVSIRKVPFWYYKD